MEIAFPEYDNNQASNNRHEPAWLFRTCTHMHGQQPTSLTKEMLHTIVNRILKQYKCSGEGERKMSQPIEAVRSHNRCVYMDFLKLSRETCRQKNLPAGWRFQLEYFVIRIFVSPIWSSSSSFLKNNSAPASKEIYLRLGNSHSSGLSQLMQFALHLTHQLLV